MSTPASLEWPTPDDGRPRTAAPDANLIVSPEDVAARLNLDPTGITAEQRTRIVNAIIDAQAVVEAELGRPLVPQTRTVAGAHPYLFAQGDTRDRDTFPILSGIYDEVRILTATANADGTFTLVVSVGLDGSQEEPIRAYVRAHAAEALRLDPQSGMGQLAVTSVSVEGQSISYEKRSTAEGAAGALPTIKTLRRYKRLSAYQAPTRVGRRPWPYAY